MASIGLLGEGEGTGAVAEAWMAAQVWAAAQDRDAAAQVRLVAQVRVSGDRTR